MMPNDNIFDHYSNYYDLLYQDKSYLNESQYIISLLRDANPEAKLLTELGSGTGNFSYYFSEAGYQVTGIEKSESMILKSKLKSIKNFQPFLADMASFGLDKPCDAVVALFDVMCYLTKTEDLVSCFQNIGRNLKKNGVFIFDSWFTPAVYTSPPLVTVKRVEDAAHCIIRLAEPVIDYLHNTVEVHYEFIIINKSNNQCTTLKEVHTLRHFSIPEVEYFAAASGFELAGCEELVTGRPPGNGTWKVCYKLLKK